MYIISFMYSLVWMVPRVNTNYNVWEMHSEKTYQTPTAIMKTEPAQPGILSDADLFE